jgi:hypothetical protein
VFSTFPVIDWTLLHQWVVRRLFFNEREAHQGGKILRSLHECRLAWIGCCNNTTRGSFRCLLSWDSSSLRVGAALWRAVAHCGSVETPCHVVCERRVGKHCEQHLNHVSMKPGFKLVVIRRGGSPHSCVQSHFRPAPD